MAHHSSTLAWKIPRAEEPGGLQSMGSLRVGHDWGISLSLFTFMHWRRKWQPTPVFLPGESQGPGEPGGLPSMGSPWVGHDWSDLAAAAAAAAAVQFSSVAQLCLTLCDPMNCSTPGLPVLHQLLEFTQTCVHQVGDAIQPSSSVVPFSSCPQSFPASESFPMSQLFAWRAQSTGVSAQHHSLQRNPRADLLQNGLLGSPFSPRGSQESSPTPQIESINSSVSSFLYDPNLTSVHDYWKNNFKYKDLCHESDVSAF